MYRSRGFDFVSVSSNDPDDKPQVIEFLKKNHASGSNLQFATPDTFGLQEAFDRRCRRRCHSRFSSRRMATSSSSNWVNWIF